MESTKVSPFKKLYRAIELNRDQLNLTSYAAQLSFYIILAIVPILLALANIIALIPFSVDEIVEVLKLAIPDQIEGVILPIIMDYLQGSSSNLFSFGLLISLWPATQIFSTLQKVLNIIYKAHSKPGFVARLLAYVFTIVFLLLAFVMSFVILFGQSIVNLIEMLFQIELSKLYGLLNQSWLIGIIMMFLMMTFIYYFIPNVKRSMKYSIPGAGIATLGFIAVSKLFTVYLQFSSGSSVSNATFGTFIALLIWLYFNGIVVCLGAYVNVLYYDFKEKSYAQLVMETRTYDTIHKTSESFNRYSEIGKVYRGSLRRKMDE